MLVMLPFSLMALSANLCAAAATKAHYNLVITNGRVHSNSKNAATAIAIAGNKIAAISDSDELEDQCKRPCRVINAHGGFMIPGFHDAHAHQAEGGSHYFHLQVSGSNPRDIAKEVRAYARKHPEKEWIFGAGWDTAAFKGKFPTRFDLDRGEAKRPVVLEDTDGHQLWVNSAALREAEITKKTQAPEGGTIVRDKNGIPTGVLLETATKLITEAMPDPSVRERESFILKGQDVGIKAGVTSTQGGPVTLELAEVYKTLNKTHRLKQRTFIWLYLESDDAEFKQALRFARSVNKDGPESKLRVVAFKGFVDGVLSAHTSALLEPYADRPNFSGRPLISQQRLNEYVLRANKAGFPVALHATGELAVRMALNAFENSKNKFNTHLINRIEHAESIAPSDIGRFKEIGVAASMQPAHMHFESSRASYYPKKLGSERLKHAFAWKELVDSGALLAFGTDYPVVEQDPIEGIYCATQREYWDETSFEEHNKIDGRTALRAFTTTPARLIGMGDELGELKPGFLADIVILKHDPRQGAESELEENPPQLVIIGGQVVLGPIHHDHSLGRGPHS